MKPRKYNPKQSEGRREREEEKKPVVQTETQSTAVTRLNKFIANSGICSRRAADVIISEGRIEINGKVTTEMGYKVKPGDVVKLNGEPLSTEELQYILLNKPKDFITTLDDPQGRKTVMKLIGDACKERIYPVGRLDRNTTGLLLFTNDGELADRLSHPSSNVRKLYEVALDKPLEEEHFDAILEGITLEDGPVKADDLALISLERDALGIEIHVGKNRIVRRIFEHFGYEVVRLDRTIYAGLTKKNLPRGKWRKLGEREVLRLKQLVKSN